MFGHFGEGCLHVRIDHDLQTVAGRQQFAEFTAAATELVVTHGGSVSGEHGDGQARSGLLAAMYSPELLRAFEEFKAAFDPDGGAEPRDPGGAAVVRRRPARAAGGAGTRRRRWRWLADAGDFGRAVRRCVGVGKCRSAAGGVMCPSFGLRATRRTPRAGGLGCCRRCSTGGRSRGGYRAPEVLDALDLCLGCKGCKTDCPVGVDMAAYKTEVLASALPGTAAAGGALLAGMAAGVGEAGRLRAAVVNRVMASPLAPVLKRVGGIAAERALPRFAARSFSRRRADAAAAARAAERGARGSGLGERPPVGGLASDAAADASAAPFGEFAVARRWSGGGVRRR